MKRKKNDEIIKRLMQYLSNPFKRKEAYANVAKEFNKSIPAIKMKASRAGLTNQEHSLQYYFSVEEEEAIEAICLKYARLSKPLSILQMIQLLRRYKNYPDSHKISRHFVTNFIRRHKNTLCLKTAKTTSPSRSSDIMDQLAEDFITSVDFFLFILN